jgi:hypothetical protein
MVESFSTNPAFRLSPRNKSASAECSLGTQHRRSIFTFPSENKKNRKNKTKSSVPDLEIEQILIIRRRPPKLFLRYYLPKSPVVSTARAEQVPTPHNIAAVDTDLHTSMPISKTSHSPGLL